MAVAPPASNHSPANPNEAAILAAEKAVKTAQQRLDVAERVVSREKEALAKAKQALTFAKAAAPTKVVKPSLFGGKEDKRELLELAELENMELAPAWAAYSMLGELRERATEVISTADAPFDLLDALALAKTVVKCEPPQVDGAVVTTTVWSPAGAWYLASVTPTRLGAVQSNLPAALDEDVLLMLGQDGEGHLRGAIGWWPAGTLSNAGGPVCAETCSRCLAIDDDSHEPQQASHTSVQGVGGGGVAPMPVMFTMAAPMHMHFAASMRETLIAKRQISARLQRGGAGGSEKDHIKELLAEHQTRLGELAEAAREADYALPAAEMSQVEAAVQGLRKGLLKRPWCPRCTSCGVRHEDIEYGTCKFWVKFKEAAIKRLEPDEEEESEEESDEKSEGDSDEEQQEDMNAIDDFTTEGQEGEEAEEEERVVEIESKDYGSEKTPEEGVTV